jgi:hypothetical protein
VKLFGPGERFHGITPSIGSATGIVHEVEINPVRSRVGKILVGFILQFLYELFGDGLNGLLCLGKVGLTGIESLSESFQVILITAMLKSRPSRWVAHLGQFSTAAQKLISVRYDLQKPEN